MCDRVLEQEVAPAVGVEVAISLVVVIEALGERGPSPHAEEMLVVYLPKEKLVFQGDLVNLPFSGKYLPSTVNDTTVHFFDWLTKSGLDIQSITAVHGPTTTLEDLRAAVERKRTGK